MYPKRQLTIVVPLSEANLIKSNGLTLALLNFSLDNCYIRTFSMSSSVKMFFIPKFMYPILLRAFRAFSFESFSKNKGVYSAYIKKKKKVTVTGIACKIIDMILQFPIK